MDQRCISFQSRNRKNRDERRPPTATGKERREEERQQGLALSKQNIP